MLNKKKAYKPYIGRPKPMKTKKFEFHKPTVGFYIGLGIFLIAAAFVTYIVIRLINVSKVVDPFIKAYTFEEKKNPETMVLENDKLKFDFDVKTTQFAVTQKNTGHVWYSNPVDANSDPSAIQKEKNNMFSTLLVKYSTENGVENTYDSWTYSIQRNFFEVKKVNNKEIDVMYTVSKMEREYKYPLAIYAEEMDEILEDPRLSSGDKSAIEKRSYKLIDESNKDYESYLERYPGLEDDDLYLVHETLQTYQKDQLEKIFAKIDYSDEDYMRHFELYKESNEKVQPAFNITVKYILEGDKLAVEIPFDDLLYKHTYPIVQLTVLPYFGAAGTSEEGFMLIPEGGGAIINFNNGKTKQNGYYADVYGWDYGTVRNAVITETRAAYPVFGESTEDSSFITIIEDGAEYAGINAEISGKLGSYNYVNAVYKMVHGEQFEVSSRTTAAQYQYEKSLPAGEKIRQVYQFIDSPSYVEMAKTYRDYLFSGKPRVNNSEAPLAIEIVGAIDKVQQVLGMPKNKPYKLTNYKEAGEIIQEVENLGIKNVNYKLTGFINDGVRQRMLKKVKYIPALGGKSGYNKMVKNTEDTSAKLYLDASMQFAYKANVFSGFNRYSDPARFASDEVCKLYRYSPVWYGKLQDEDPYYLINARNQARADDVVQKNVLKTGLAGISYADNGYILSADYNEDRRQSRAAAKNQSLEKMQAAKDNNLGIMINAGNAYALEKADFITNMTLHGNSYAIIDEIIPFYQIALHGYKNFTGSSLNLAYENDQLVLEAAESGAGLYFTFMNESEKKIQETSFTEYYSANFDSWKDRLESIYKRYNSEVGKVSNSLIWDFKHLDDSVTVTSFDNGYDIYVNFGYVDFTTDSGIVIPAREYKVQKVEG
ncbi:MAG: DUF5696 domain-containing protein [Treponema sp.]|nr:DUF5696 domain-containing protein [Treponema sp.]